MTPLRRTVISQFASILLVLTLVTWWSSSVRPPVWVGLALGFPAGLVAVLLGAVVGGFWNGRYRRGSRRSASSPRPGGTT